MTQTPRATEPAADLAPHGSSSDGSQRDQRSRQISGHPVLADPQAEVEELGDQAGDPAGRRSLLVAGIAGAAGMGMIAAGVALARWPDAVLASVDRVFMAMGGAPGPIDTATRPSNRSADDPSLDPGGSRP